MNNLTNNIDIEQPKETLPCLGDIDKNDGFWFNGDFIVYLGAAWSDGTDCFNLSQMKNVNIPPWTKVKPIKWKIIEK